MAGQVGSALIRLRRLTTAAVLLTPSRRHTSAGSAAGASLLRAVDASAWGGGTSLCNAPLSAAPEPLLPPPAADAVNAVIPLTATAPPALLDIDCGDWFPDSPMLCAIRSLSRRRSRATVEKARLHTAHVFVMPAHCRMQTQWKAWKQQGRKPRSAGATTSWQMTQSIEWASAGGCGVRCAVAGMCCSCVRCAVPVCGAPWIGIPAGAGRDGEATSDTPAAGRAAAEGAAEAGDTVEDLMGPLLLALVARLADSGSLLCGGGLAAGTDPACWDGACALLRAVALPAAMLPAETAPAPAVPAAPRLGCLYRSATPAR
jgi:hypothetical protein